MKGSALSFMANPVVLFVIGIVITIFIATIIFGVNPDNIINTFKGFGSRP